MSLAEYIHTYVGLIKKKKKNIFFTETYPCVVVFGSFSNEK